jgi:hypothetical protein
MTPVLMTLAITTSVLAVALYEVSAKRRLLRAAFPAFPARVSAASAAMVALQAFIEMFGTPVGILAWLSLLTFGAMVLSCLPVKARSPGAHP